MTLISAYPVKLKAFLEKTAIVSIKPTSFVDTIAVGDWYYNPMMSKYGSSKPSREFNEFNELLFYRVSEVSILESKWRGENELLVIERYARIKYDLAITIHGKVTRFSLEERHQTNRDYENHMEKISEKELFEWAKECRGEYLGHVLSIL